MDGLRVLLAWCLIVGWICGLVGRSMSFFCRRWDRGECRKRMDEYIH